MANHGARNIVALSRSGVKDQQSWSFIQEMNARGVRVVGKACDVSSIEQVKALVEEVASDGMPPIRGIVQAAMVLRVRLHRSRSPPLAIQGH